MLWKLKWQIIIKISLKGWLTKFVTFLLTSPVWNDSISCSTAFERTFFMCICARSIHLPCSTEWEARNLFKSFCHPLLLSEQSVFNLPPPTCSSSYRARIYAIWLWTISGYGTRLRVDGNVMSFCYDIKIKESISYFGWWNPPSHLSRDFASLPAEKKERICTFVLRLLVQLLGSIKRERAREGGMQSWSWMFLVYSHLFYCLDGDRFLLHK